MLIYLKKIKIKLQYNYYFIEKQVLSRIYFAWEIITSLLYLIMNYCNIIA